MSHKARILRVAMMESGSWFSGKDRENERINGIKLCKKDTNFSGEVPRKSVVKLITKT